MVTAWLHGAAAIVSNLTTRVAQLETVHSNAHLQVARGEAMMGLDETLDGEERATVTIGVQNP